MCIRDRLINVVLPVASESYGLTKFVSNLLLRNMRKNSSEKERDPSVSRILNRLEQYVKTRGGLDIVNPVVAHTGAKHNKQVIDILWNGGGVEKS